MLWGISLRCLELQSIVSSLSQYTFFFFWCLTTSHHWSKIFGQRRKVQVQRGKRMLDLVRRRKRNRTLQKRKRMGVVNALHSILLLANTHRISTQNLPPSQDLPSWLNLLEHNLKFGLFLDTSAFSPNYFSKVQGSWMGTNEFPPAWRN